MHNTKYQNIHIDSGRAAETTIKQPKQIKKTITQWKLKRQQLNNQPRSLIYKLTMPWNFKTYVIRPKDQHYTKHNTNN